MRKVTEVEINQIFDFTKKHYVEFYDVQVELVDHLANAIEEQWKEDPSISFEDALQIEFKKFGVFGFTGLVEQKQNELHKYYNKMLWKEIVKFVSIPKVVITILLYLSVFYTLKNYGTLGEIITVVLLIALFTYFAIDGLRYVFQIKKAQKNQGRRWLIQSVAQSAFSLPTIGISGAYYAFINRFFEENYNLTNVGFHFLSAFFVFQVICTFVFYKNIKPSLNKSIQETEKRFQFA